MPSPRERNPAEQADIGHRALLGALAGLSATVPMTAAMWAIYRALPAEQRYGTEPRLVTEGMLTKAAEVRSRSARLTERQREALTSILHLCYGTSAGAAWMALDRRTLDSPLVHGALGGLAVWAAGYLGWLPAMRILRPEYRRPPGRAVENIVAHLVWGVCAAETAAAAARWSHQWPMADGRAR